MPRFSPSDFDDVDRQSRLQLALASYLDDLRGHPRVVLIGNYGQGNLGDEAICSGLVQIMSPHSDVTVMSREPDRVIELHGVASAATTSLTGVKALLRADVVAIGGGGIFGNGMTLLPKLLPLLALVLRALNKRVIFVAIGAYTSAPRWVQAVLRLLASTSSLVTVRDAESQEVLGKRVSILVDDPAIALAPVGPAEARKALSAAGVDLSRPLLGISLKPAMDPGIDDTQRLVARAAAESWCRNTGGDVVFFSLSERGNFGLGTSITDLSMAGEIISTSVYASRMHTFGPHVRPDLMKGVIGEVRGMVAHRLHAQIFAWSMNIALVGLSYERKADAFLDEVGAKRLDLRNLDTEEVVVWVDALSRSEQRA